MTGTVAVLVRLLVAGCLLAAAAGCSTAGLGSAYAPDTTSAGAPAPEGVLRFALERPAHLDPARARSVPQSELVVADLLYDGLTAYDGEAAEVVSALAVSWEADGTLTSWRFTLDPTARFADGSPVMAGDVKASFERIVSIGADAQAARLLAPVAGWADVASGATDDLAGVTVEGGAVVVIKLAEPMSELPERLSSPLLGVAPSGATAASLDLVPEGSGPFRPTAEGSTLPRWSDAEVVHLQALEGDAVVEGVDLVFVEDGAAAVAAVAEGRADVAYLADATAPDPSLTAVSAPFDAELFYGLNLRHPKFSDVRFRQAIVAAVDEEAIVSDVYGGALSPIGGAVPSAGTGGGQRRCATACEHDAEQARALVAEAFPDGAVPEVYVDVDEGGRQEDVGAAIAADLVAAGIPASVRVHAVEEYPAFLASGDQEVFRYGWSGGWPSSGAYLRDLFRTGAPGNAVGMSEPGVDLALDRAALVGDPRPGGGLRRG